MKTILKRISAMLLVVVMIFPAVHITADADVVTAEEGYESTDEYEPLAGIQFDLYFAASMTDYESGTVKLPETNVTALELKAGTDYILTETDVNSIDTQESDRFTVALTTAGMKKVGNF